MAWLGVVTNVGKSLINSLARGQHILTLTKATVGTGIVPAVDLRDQVAVTDERATASIISAVKVDDGTKYKIQVGPADLSGSYTAHQIGVWAKLDDGEETLLMLTQDDGAGISVPTEFDSPNFAFALFVVLALHDRSDVVINIDQSAYVTVSTLNEALERVAALHPLHASVQLVAPGGSSTGNVGVWVAPQGDVDVELPTGTQIVMQNWSNNWITFVYVEGVMDDSVITKSWFSSGAEYVLHDITAEPGNYGAIKLSTPYRPDGAVQLDMLIVK